MEGRVPVWYHAGMIRTGETHQNVVKMTRGYRAEHILGRLGS